MAPKFQAMLAEGQREGLAAELVGEEFLQARVDRIVETSSRHL